MFKWVSWAARTVLTAVLLSFLCIWTTGYIVNSYMETVLRQLNLPLQTQPFALSGIWGKMWGAGPAPVKQAAPTASPAETEDKVSSPTPTPSKASAGHAEEQSSAVSPSPSDDSAVPVFGSQAGTSEMSEQQRLSLKTVMSKLNAEQLGKLTASLENGLTEDELTALGDLIKPSLSDKEYKQMMEMLQSHTEAAPTPSNQP
jgi:hypothetical protein